MVDVDADHRPYVYGIEEERSHFLPVPAGSHSGLPWYLLFVKISRICELVNKSLQAK